MTAFQYELWILGRIPGYSSVRFCSIYCAFTALFLSNDGRDEKMKNSILSVILLFLGAISPFTPLLMRLLDKFLPDKTPGKIKTLVGITRIHGWGNAKLAKLIKTNPTLEELAHFRRRKFDKQDKKSINEV